MERSTQPAIEELALADWRRRIVELYAEVRRLALTDPPAAHAEWREIRERLYREHAESPVPPAERPGFRAHHFPYDPSVRFEVAVDAPPVAPPAAGAAGLTLPNSGTDVLAFRRVGVLEIPFAGGTRRLSLFWIEGYAGGLFLPFRDATNGQETYGAGRYLLDGAKGADLGSTAGRMLVLDFNFAFQPSCAFDPRWACPLAPPENRLDVAIRAGERLVRAPSDEGTAADPRYEGPTRPGTPEGSSASGARVHHRVAAMVGRGNAAPSCLGRSVAAPHTGSIG